MKGNSDSILNKVDIVREVLWNRKNEYITSFDIRKGIEEQISEGELDTILHQLVAAGTVLEDYLKIDGDISSILIYKLSLRGILIIENEFNKNNVTSLATSKLTRQPVIALKYVYLNLAGINEGINENNRNKIALDNGWKSANSGRSLHDDYKFYERDARNRYQPKISDPEDAGYYRSKQNMIANLKAVISELKDYPKALSLAESDLNRADSKAK